MGIPDEKCCLDIFIGCHRCDGQQHSIYDHGLSGLWLSLPLSTLLPFLSVPPLLSLCLHVMVFLFCRVRAFGFNVALCLCLSVRLYMFCFIMFVPLTHMLRSTRLLFDEMRRRNEEKCEKKGIKRAAVRCRARPQGANSWSSSLPPGTYEDIEVYGYFEKMGNRRDMGGYGK